MGGGPAARVRACPITAGNRCAGGEPNGFWASQGARHKKFIKLR
jgi:hypothetical protein